MKPRQGILPTPSTRRLRGYAFDPSLSLRLDTALINHTVYQVDWEPDLMPGPVGEYLEIVDFDPSSACWYEPVDLNAKEILAQDGLAPSEGTPQFHQQMVYAVAMTTIRNFEYALGRRIFWAHRHDPTLQTGKRDLYVQRLRIYPHALRGANAYYSPSKCSVLFGYFRSPTGMVFTCLSHDIIAHEVTHALLDGMHRRYIEDNHVDALAFHEAFADLVALFQHFTFPEVLRHQIAHTRGDLSAESLLGELAQQFGEATCRYGALRSAIGERDKAGKWKLVTPEPNLLAENTEPHARGAILVAAIFRAFLAIYNARISDLMRLATAGTGILPAGAIHPDLIDRLADEATNTAKHFLTICIRSLDYCPPIDINFGDYLRAMITADFDMVPDDKLGYRIALIESFRQWGIVPEGVRTLSEEHLRWPAPNTAELTAFAEVAEKLRPLITESLYFDDRAQSFSSYVKAQEQTHTILSQLLSDSTKTLQRKQFEMITGLNITDVDAQQGLGRRSGGKPSFEVHAIRPVLRVNPSGQIIKQMVVSLAQRRRVAVDPENPGLGEFDFRAGSTLIFDLEGLTLRYAITRRIDDQDRLNRVREHRKSLAADHLSIRDTYFGGSPVARVNRASEAKEPFCLLHSAD